MSNSESESHDNPLRPNVFSRPVAEQVVNPTAGGYLDEGEMESQGLHEEGSPSANPGEAEPMDLLRYLRHDRDPRLVRRDELHDFDE